MLIILQLQQSLINNKVVKKCKRALSILKVPFYISLYGIFI